MFMQNAHASMLSFSYIPQMLMLKIYRPRWTQCDDTDTLHDPLGLVMGRKALMHVRFDFLWFLNIFMMFTYLKLRMFVSSTGQNGQVKYYHLVSVVCYP
jgi:hypothetical protein